VKGTLAISDLLASYYVEGSLFRYSEKPDFQKFMELYRNGNYYKLLVGNALQLS